MRTLRVSELSAYLYCQRAWWYRRQGFESENQTELASGNELNINHGRAVLVSGCLKGIAYTFFLAALVIFSVYFSKQLF